MVTKRSVNQTKELVDKAVDDLRSLGADSKDIFVARKINEIIDMNLSRASKDLEYMQSVAE